MREFSNFSAHTKALAAISGYLSQAFSVAANCTTIMQEHAYTAQEHAIGLKEYCGEAISGAEEELRHRYRRHVFGTPLRISNIEFGTCVERRTINKFGHEFNTVYAEAQNAEDIVVMALGCKSQPIHWQREIEFVHEELGLPVFCTSLSFPKREAGFAQANMDYTEYLLFDENSALRRVMRERGHKKLHLMSHSFGGAMDFYHALYHPQSYAEAISSTIRISPFLGAMELNDDRFIGQYMRELFFNQIVANDPKALNGQTWASIMHAHLFRLLGEPYLRAASGPPALGQIKEMETTVTPLRKAIFEDGFDDMVKSIPSLIIQGGWDYSSDPMHNIKANAQWEGEIEVIPRVFHTPTKEAEAQCFDHIGSFYAEHTLASKPHIIPVREHEGLQPQHAGIN